MRLRVAQFRQVSGTGCDCLAAVLRVVWIASVGRPSTWFNSHQVDVR
jgi:hypothetical protein